MALTMAIFAECDPVAYIEAFSTIEKPWLDMMGLKFNLS